MEQYFHGNRQNAGFFEGWYLKHQSEEHTLILIPSFHCGPKGENHAALQLILDGMTRSVFFSPNDFEASPHRLYIRLGQNIFSSRGCRLHLDLPGLSVRGHIRYGTLQTPRRSFMGPFRSLPLPCYHRVLSLAHTLRGQILLNGRHLSFTGGIGYAETDWGKSFPGSYLWLQCGWPQYKKQQGGGSGLPVSTFFSAASLSCVMFTAVRLTLAARNITACSSLILHNGRQYRLSTWQGARLLHLSARRITLRQGNYLLQILMPTDQSADAGIPVRLHAPEEGKLCRFVTEYPRTPMRCQLYQGGQMLLDEVIPAGSYELCR